MPQPTFTSDAPSREAHPESVRRESVEISRLHSAFLELDEVHRIVLCLHFVERLSIEEIALILDDTEHNVRNVYVEAVSRLTGHVEMRKDAA